MGGFRMATSLHSYRRSWTTGVCESVSVLGRGSAGGSKGSTRACSHGAGSVGRSWISSPHALAVFRAGRQPFGILLVLVDVDYL